MKRCMECLGKGLIFCPVCQGTRRNPRNTARECGYCDGRGYVTCNICGGSGKLDDNDDYKR